MNDYSILVIDDEPYQAQAIKSWLEKAKKDNLMGSYSRVGLIDTENSAYKVCTALDNFFSSPAEVGDFPFRLLISDVFMPDPNQPGSPASIEHGGLAIYRKLRALYLKAQNDVSLLAKLPKLALVSNRPEDISPIASELVADQRSQKSNWLFYMPKSTQLKRSDSPSTLGLLNHTEWMHVLRRMISQADKDKWMDGLISGSLSDLGTSAPMLHIKLELERLKDSRVICVTGESGSGKEFIFQALYELRGSKGRLHKVNLSAEEHNPNIESWMFGQDPGHYNVKAEGEIEKAKFNGVLVLDEANVRVLALIEPKLRRLIEEGTYRRKAQEDEGDKRFEGTIIFASSDLDDYLENVASDDFISRIGDARIRVPPLREHREDIPILAKRFFEIEFKKRRELEDNSHASIPQLTPRLIAYLQEQDWRHGNVRSLMKCMRFLATKCEESLIDVDFLLSFPPLQNMIGIKSDRENSTPMEIYRQLLTDHGNNRTKVAKALNISRPAVSQMTKKLGLDTEFPGKGGRPLSKKD